VLTLDISIVRLASISTPRRVSRVPNGQTPSPSVVEFDRRLTKRHECAAGKRRSILSSVLTHCAGRNVSPLQRKLTAPSSTRSIDYVSRKPLQLPPPHPVELMEVAAFERIIEKRTSVGQLRDLDSIAVTKPPSRDVRRSKRSGDTPPDVANQS